MNVLRTIRKIRKMSADELRVRLAESAWRRRERRLYRRFCCRGSPSLATRLEAAFDLQRFRKATQALVPGAQQGELGRLEGLFPGTLQALRASARSRAQAVVSGDWQLLGRSVDLGRDVPWHRDPASGADWPRRFYADLALYDGREGGDVKHVWELGRQQFLVELARGWLFSGNAHYAERARALILDWIDRNPLFEGVHWASALELAVRAISWLWTMATLGTWNGWRPGEMQRIAESLADHAGYLEHHLSFCSSPFNHLIGEASGLYLIGVSLEQLEEAKRWRRVGRQVLIEHAPQQFYGDGFCLEQATGYHFFTLGFLSLAVATARAEGEPLKEIEPVLRRAYRAGVALRQPDGRWPAIGDVDSARSIPVYHDDFWDFDSLCSLGAALFDDPELKSSEENPGEEVYWVLGCDGVESWKRLPWGASPRHAVLPESGYAVARHGDDWVLFDAGPIAEGLYPDSTPSTAHGHADALQVLYSRGKRPLLRDPGMPSYAGPPEWVEHFRSPEAHNTLAIEGAPMARAAGLLDWSNVAKRPCLDANVSEEVTLLRGRAEWAPGVVVERYLLAVEELGLWIADWIQTDRPRRVRWFWQLPAGSVQGVQSNASGRSVVQGPNMVLAAWSDAGPLSARIETPNENSPVAWEAPGYGQRQTGQRVCCTAEADGTLLAVTYVGRSPSPVAVSVRGDWLICVTGEPDLPDLLRDLPSGTAIRDADIVWRLWTDRGLLTYAAGEALRRTETGWTLLPGVGGWPAICARGLVRAVC